MKPLLLLALLLAPSLPAEEEDGSAMKTLSYLPTGSRNENVRIPSIKRDQLATLMQAGVMTKVDDLHLKLERFRLQMFESGNRKPPLLFTTPLGVYNTETSVLTSDVTPVLERDDFRMTAKRASFNAKTKRGTMAGDVKLIATLREEKKPSPKKEPTPPKKTGLVFPNPLTALFGQVAAPSSEPTPLEDLEKANERLDQATKSLTPATADLSQARSAAQTMDPLIQSVRQTDPFKPLNDLEAKIVELTDTKIKTAMDAALPADADLKSLPDPKTAVAAVETTNPFAGFSQGSGKAIRTDKTTIITSASSFFDSDKSITVFSGSVKLDTPDYQIACDDLETHWEKNDGEEKSTDKKDPLGESGGGQKIKLAIAKGVKVTVEKLNPDGKISLGECRYLAHDGKTGDMLLRVWPKVQDGNSLIVGTSINTEMLFRQDGQVTVRGPHLIIILPKEQKVLPENIAARLRPPADGAGTAIPGSQNPYGVVAQSQGAAPRSDGAVMIIANQCVYDSNAAAAVFQDKVFIDHPEFLMSCDKLDLTFIKDKAADAPDETEKVPKAPDEKERNQTLKTAVATGKPVRIEKLNPTAELELAESQHATYDGQTGDLILRTWAKVQKGNTVIMGTSEQTKITFFSIGEVKANGIHRIYALPKKSAPTP